MKFTKEEAPIVDTNNRRKNNTKMHDLTITPKCTTGNIKGNAL
ncbi:41681_t:CDS:1, partial [Gigaspora margarita]